MHLYDFKGDLLKICILFNLLHPQIIDFPD